MAQQLREATPFDQRPRYLIRDNDRKYGAAFAHAVPHERANALCERFLGSVRRECHDQLLVLGERQLTRVLREYVAYFNRDRPHQGLGQATPEPPPAQSRCRTGAIRAAPVLGGLHHTYQRAA